MKAMKGGRQMSFSALVLIGNGNGSAGLGYGKALKVQDAVRMANIDGEKNIVHIKRHEGTRNVSNVVVRDKGCIVFKQALASGGGIKGNYLVLKMAEAFGLDGLSVKVMGPRSKNLGTRAKTIFKALQITKDPETEAMALGKMLFNPHKVWRRRPYESIY
jgi:small subunit ribosomal protein S5